MQPIAARGGQRVQWYGFDAGSINKTADPRLDRHIKRDPPGIGEQCNFPGRHGAEQYGPAAMPTIVDKQARRREQTVVTAVEPKDDMRIEQQGIGHCSTSRPVAASGSSSRA